jgi:hypothetical protein
MSACGLPRSACLNARACLRSTASQERCCSLSVRRILISWALSHSGTARLYCARSKACVPQCPAPRRSNSSNSNRRLLLNHARPLSRCRPRLAHQPPHHVSPSFAQRHQRVQLQLVVRRNRCLLQELRTIGAFIGPTRSLSRRASRRALVLQRHPSTWPTESSTRRPRTTRFWRPSWSGDVPSLQRRQIRLPRRRRRRRRHRQQQQQQQQGALGLTTGCGQIRSHQVLLQTQAAICCQHRALCRPELGQALSSFVVRPRNRVDCLHQQRGRRPTRSWRAS